MRMGFVGVLQAVTLHTTNLAHADEMPWRLEYRHGADAPSNCPEENDIRTALSTKIGARDPFSNEAPRNITIDVTRTTERIEARIQARDAQANIVSDSIAHVPSWRCDLLATRIVFVLRDIVDPLNPSTPASSPLGPKSPPVTDERGRAGEPEKPTPPVFVEKPSVSQNAPKRLSAQPKPQFAFSMGLGASWWNAPNTALSTSFGIASRWRRISIGLEGRYDYAWTLPLDKEVIANQAAIALTTCGHHAFVPGFYGHGCLFGDVTRISVDSVRVRTGERASFLLQLGLRFGAGFSVTPRWALELQADIRFAVQQAAFAYDHQELWQVPRFHGAIRVNVVRLFNVF